MKRILHLLFPICLGIVMALILGIAAQAAQPQREVITTQPHPILSDVRVRQALAYCTDKVGLVAAAYPDLDPAQREALIVDSFIPPTSWAYTPPTTTYPYDPALAGALLDAAGWVWPAGETYRMKDGRELTISLKTTDAQLRIDVVNAYTAQLATCGIHLIGITLPSGYFFGDSVLYIRDFSIAEFAWISDPNEPGGYSLYSCDQIPSPDNGWVGQNYMGWCNPNAQTALITATNTSLPQDVRKAAYAQVTDYIALDVPTIPLFLRNGSIGTFEHFDFNLETFSSMATINNSQLTVLDYQDFLGHTGTIEIPPGSVITPTEVNDLMYSPLRSTRYGPPARIYELIPFRLTEFTRGVPLDTYPFSQPITVTVPFNNMDLSHVYTSTISLYYAVSNTFTKAVDTCPVGLKYELLDLQNDVYTVRVCHLTEFTLAGVERFRTYLPVTDK